MEQINYTENATTLIGEHPIQYINQIVKSNQAQNFENTSRFEAFVSTALSKNEKYDQELSLVFKQLTNDDFKPVPTSILSKEDFQTAMGLLRESEPTLERARFVNGRILIQEEAEKFTLYGPNYLIGIGLHEGAHASLKEKPVIPVTFTTDLGNTVISGIGGLGGFHKYKAEIKDGNIDMRILGDFWEEGFADLYRVRAMKDMNIQWQKDEVSQGVTVDDEGTQIAYVGKGLTRPHSMPKEKRTYLPFEYAVGVSSEKTDNDMYSVDPSLSGVAAYAINLLDEREPGLFEDMKASRHDVGAYSSFVQKINAIKPGLYQELRSLSQNPAEFQSGLVSVLSALDLSDTPVKV